MKDFKTVKMISILIRAGIFLLLVMLTCAIFAKGVLLLPFVLINFVILQYVGWQYKKSSGHEKTSIGKNFRVFLGLFMVLGLSSLFIKLAM